MNKWHKVDLNMMLPFKLNGNTVGSNMKSVTHFKAESVL